MLEVLQGMVRQGLFILLSALFLMGPAFSKTQTVELRNGTVNFELPDNKWKFYKDMLGLPLVLVSPMEESQRVTISITPTGVDNIPLDPKKLKSEQNAWFLGRKRFVDKFKGEITKKFDYQTLKTAHLDEVHKIGYQYSVEDKLFESYSFYFYCDKLLYHVKSLHEARLFPAAKSSIDKFFNTLNCQ